LPTFVVFSSLLF